MIGGLEGGGIIPFPVLKFIFEPLGSNKKHLVKEVFLMRGLEGREIVPFPVCKMPFPVLKMNFEPLGSNEKHFVKGIFLSEVYKYQQNKRKLMVSVSERVVLFVEELSLLKIRDVLQEREGATF